MKIGFFFNSCSTIGSSIMKSFAEGVKKVGDCVVELNKVGNVDVDCVVMWSVLFTKPIRKEIYYFYKSRNIPIIVIEVGGLIRNKTWKVGLNGINSDAIFLNKNQKENRWKKFNIELKPYRNTGNDIIICGQHRMSLSWNLGSTICWVKNLISEIRKYNKSKRIIFRPHPRYKVEIPSNFDCIVQEPKFIGNYDCFDFVESLKNAYLVINYNSNPAIEAIINGINIYTGKSSLCYSVSIKDLKNINNLPNPCRIEWSNEIAYTEWFEDEIREGIPYKRLREII